MNSTQLRVMRAACAIRHDAILAQGRGTAVTGLRHPPGAIARKGTHGAIVVKGTHGEREVVRPLFQAVDAS